MVLLALKKVYSSKSLLKFPQPNKKLPPAKLPFLYPFYLFGKP